MSIGIESVGDMLYTQVKPILARVQDPEQLRRIEENSPQLQGEDVELWKKLIARDVPTWEKKDYYPSDPSKWYKVYKRYVREQKEEIERDKEQLRATMMGIKANREQHTSQLVDLKKVVVPRDPRMRVGDGARKRPGFQKDMSTLNFNAGSKTKMVDGKSVLNRARKEAKEIHAMGRLNKLTHTLTGNSSQVRKAPEGMRREYEIATQPSLARVLMTKRKSVPEGSSRTHLSLGADLDEREARLRKAMQPKSGKQSSDDESRGTKRNIVDFSDDDGSHDDIFDEPPLKRVRAIPSLPPLPGSVAQPPTSAKPSDMISKMLAMKKSNPPTVKSRLPPSIDSLPSTSTVSQPKIFKSSPVSSPPPIRKQMSSPPPTAATPRRPPPPPGMVRRKKEVDIFNRKAMRRPTPR